MSHIALVCVLSKQIIALRVLEVMTQLDYKGNKLAFDSLLNVLSLQLFAEARFHASARPHV